MKSNGFTLVEMLVALGIFALLATAGVGVLRASVDLQSTVDAQLTASSGLARLNALLSSDLGQAVDRASRASNGERPAFVGDGSGMQFVSTGRANLDGAPRSELQRVEWRARNGVLERTGFAAIDGGEQGVASRMAKDIGNAAFRYRMHDGSWTSAFSSTPRQPLPAAVELTLKPKAGAAIVMVLALPAGSIPPPPTSPSPSSGPPQDQLPPSEQGA